MKHYLKLAWADLIRHKFFSFLNVTGLAFGISLCMVIITIIRSQLTYDRFHPSPEKTFRINTEALHKNGSTERYATSPLPLANYLKDNYAFVTDAVSLTGGLSGDAQYKEKTIFINGFLSNTSFFNVFGYKLKYGDAPSALDDPNALVLTHTASLKLFGSAVNPIGQVLSVQGLGNFMVSGVLEEPKGKTHLEFDAIGSNKALPALEKNNKIFPVLNKWENYFTAYTYVLLQNESDKDKITQSLASISSKQYSGQQLEANDEGYKLYPQPIHKIIPGAVLSNNMGKTLPEDVLWYLAAVGLIVIACAGFNYNSLTLARALSRSKEIGIRKTAGARKYQLVIQFLVQSVVAALVALVAAAMFFHYLLRPYIEDIEIFKSAGIILYEDVWLYVLFMIFTIIVGLFSGLFPALYLASFNPLNALRSSTSFGLTPKLSFRKVLLAVQFAIALFFVIGLVNISRQINFVLGADYGFQKDNIITVNLQNNDYVKVRQQLSAVTGVMVVSGSSHSMGTTRDRSVDVKFNKAEEAFRVKDFTIDEYYLESFGLSLAAGQNFKKELSALGEKVILVNETFVNFFRLGSPAAAIGKSIILSDSVNVTIQGVLKDFNYQPLTKAILPVIFRYNTTDISQLNIVLNTTDVSGALLQLTKAWKGFDNTNAFKYSFLSDELRQAYTQYSSLPRLLGLIAILSIIVAGLGLVGLAAFTLKQRLKEITIRKILGATVTEIALLLSKSFALMVVAGLIIGLPVSVHLTNLFMQNFAFRINPFLGYLIAAGLLIGTVFLSVGIQIIRTAKMNPVKNLRTE